MASTHIYTVGELKRFLEGIGDHAVVMIEHTRFAIPSHEFTDSGSEYISFSEVVPYND